LDSRDLPTVYTPNCRHIEHFNSVLRATSLQCRAMSSSSFQKLSISFRRQLCSAPFQINLRETYFVSLHLDDSADDWYQDGRCNYKNVLGSKWQVYRLSSKAREQRELWANSDEMTQRYYYYAGGFTATSGQYELEWDLPAGDACLDHRHPRLMVYTGATG